MKVKKNYKKILYNFIPIHLKNLDEMDTFPIIQIIKSDLRWSRKF